MISLEKKFYNSLNQEYLFENRPKVAIAVSGGPDSIALVFLMQNWIRENKGKLIALIVNHQMRENSSEEAVSVKRYLFKKNINSVVLKISKKNILKFNMSQARENRFSKMINYCKKNNIFHLFIGHHYDDNLETFLIRKIAGSNFEGLNCIQERTVYKNIRILRPLLKFSRKQIINYLHKNDFHYVKDPSNKNEKYSRVKVRNFLKQNSFYLIDIKQDIKLIKDNIDDYKSMIYQIFNLINIEFSKNMIVFESVNFFNLDKELQIKLTEIVYKFFNPNNPYLRYKKIINALNIITKITTKSLVISRMSIKKDNNCIYFTPVI